MNVACLVIQLVVPPVRIYVGVCHVSPPSRAKRFEKQKQIFFSLPKLQLDTDRPVYRPFQLVGMELVESEVYEEGFPYVSSHDLSDSICFRQKINQLPTVTRTFAVCSSVFSNPIEGQRSITN